MSFCVARGVFTSPRGASGDHIFEGIFFSQTHDDCFLSIFYLPLTLFTPLTSLLKQDRFVGSLTSLRDKNQRTVYRLTLVAGWNAEDAMEYAKLIDLGKPDLIEIKGMTYCGDSSGASNLTMKNVPYHEDVKKFGESLCNARVKLLKGREAEGDNDSIAPSRDDASGASIDTQELTGGTPKDAEYGLACEHAHSCCILLARKDPYLKDGKWHTWIDYDKFQDLVASGKPFTSDEYMLPTPAWSVWGAPEGGFDPGERRVRKVRNHPGKEAKEQDAKS